MNALIDSIWKISGQNIIIIIIILLLLRILIRIRPNPNSTKEFVDSNLNPKKIRISREYSLMQIYSVPAKSAT
jgi:hypothetical protein